MAQITREEALANMNLMVSQLEQRITELTRALSVTMVDDQPFVVVLDSGLSTPSALKQISENSWNMSAQGLDAMTFGKVRAELIAKQHGYKVMGKREFYAAQIKSAGETIAWAKEIMDKKAA